MSSERMPSPAAMRAANAIADDFTPGFCDDGMVEAFARHIDAAAAELAGAADAALSHVPRAVMGPEALKRDVARLRAARAEWQGAPQ